MSAAAAAYSRIEWRTECVRLLKEILADSGPDATLARLIDTVERVPLNDSDLPIAVAAAVARVQEAYTTPTFTDGPKEFAYYGFDGRVRLGVLLDNAHAALV